MSRFNRQDCNSKNQEFVKTAEDAVEYMDRIMYNAGYEDNTKYIIREAKGKERSQYRKHNDYGEVIINTKQPGWFEALMHELGHGACYNVPELRAKLDDLLVDIETGKVIKVQGYSGDVPKYKETKISMPSWYCTRLKDGRCEELLTMWLSCFTGQTTRRNDMNSGVEMFCPADFARQFPDYFNAILRILRK